MNLRCIFYIQAPIVSISVCNAIKTTDSFAYLLNAWFQWFFFVYGTFVVKRKHLILFDTNFDAYAYVRIGVFSRSIEGAHLLHALSFVVREGVGVQVQCC